MFASSHPKSTGLVLFENRSYLFIVLVVLSQKIAIKNYVVTIVIYRCRVVLLPSV